MKAYFNKLFEHELWANIKVLETLMSIEEAPQKAIEIFSHIIAAQRIWLDRIMGNENEMKVWEVFERNIMLELLEINHTDLRKLLDNQDINQLIAYQNSKGEHFTSTITQIFTHLCLHASYHRGQVCILLKNHVAILPATDYILYVR